MARRSRGAQARQNSQITLLISDDGEKSPVQPAAPRSAQVPHSHEARLELGEAPRDLPPGFCQAGAKAPSQSSLLGSLYIAKHRLHNQSGKTVFSKIEYQIYPLDEFHTISLSQGVTFCASS